MNLSWRLIRQPVVPPSVRRAVFLGIRRSSGKASLPALLVASGGVSRGDR